MKLSAWKYSVLWLNHSSVRIYCFSVAIHELPEEDEEEAEETTATEDQGTIQKAEETAESSADATLKEEKKETAEAPAANKPAGKQ